MTISSEYIDGWPIHPNYRTAPLVRTEKSMDIKAKEWSGRELAIAIRQSLQDRGISISDERYELIAEACEKPLDNQPSD